MAEKIKDGISRELRYVEYRLRKRKSDKKKKNFGSSDTSTSSMPDNFKEAIPTNHGEEDLQLQVALAVSREEAKDQEKTELSDKIRLEMALKESAEVAAKVVAQHTPNHVNSVVNNQISNNDPWKSDVLAGQQNSFDPFASKSSDLGFGDDAWLASSTSQVSAESQADPWLTSATNLSTPVALSNSNDVWGGVDKIQANNQNDYWSESNSVAFGSQSKITHNQNDPWSTDQNFSNNMWNDLEHKSAVALSSDPWGIAPNSVDSVNKCDIKGGLGSDLDFFKVQASIPSINNDPIKEFNQLTIQPASSNVPSASTFSADLFGADVMTPQPVTNQTEVATDCKNLLSDSRNHKAGAFLGEAANLVNVDSLISKPGSSHSFVPINSTSASSLGASRNPFNQKGPSMSLNQMKSENQNPFIAQQSQEMRPSMISYPAGTTVQPTGINVPFGAGMGSFTPQLSYGMSTAGIPKSSSGMSGGFQQNAINPFQSSQSQASSISVQHTDQLLF